jgi:hypothetical protein
LADEIQGEPQGYLYKKGIVKFEREKVVVLCMLKYMAITFDLDALGDVFTGFAEEA